MVCDVSALSCFHQTVLFSHHVSQRSRIALQQAVVNLHKNVTKLLLADPRTAIAAQDEDGMTALHLAELTGDRELVALFEDTLTQSEQTAVL